MKKYTVDEWIKKQQKGCNVYFEFNRLAVREYLERNGLLKKRRKSCQ